MLCATTNEDSVSFFSFYSLRFARLRVKTFIGILRLHHRGNAAAARERERGFFCPWKLEYGTERIIDTG